DPARGEMVPFEALVPEGGADRVEGAVQRGGPRLEEDHPDHDIGDVAPAVRCDLRVGHPAQEPRDEVPDAPLDDALDDAQRQIRGIVAQGAKLQPGKGENAGKEGAPTVAHTLERGNRLAPGGSNHGASSSASRSPVRWKKTSSSVTSRVRSERSRPPRAARTSSSRAVSASTRGGSAGTRTRSTDPGPSSLSQEYPSSASPLGSSPTTSASIWPARPTRAFSAAGVPSATIRPWSITTRRRHSSSASNIRWVVITTVIPVCSFTSRMKRRMCRAPATSSLIVGSSRNSR